LIDAVTGGHLWAERYDRDLTDIFAVQDDVTMRIVEVLKVKLLPAERDGIVSVPRASVETHDIWLRARDLYATLFQSPADPAAILRKVIAAYEEVALRDPGFALVYAGLSLAWGMEFQNRWLGEPQAQERSRDYALKAVEIGPTEAFGYFALSITSIFSGDAAAARAQAQHALSLNPNYASAYGAIGNAEIFLGRPLDALAWFDIAARLDPVTTPQTLHFRGLAERIRLVPGTDISRSFYASALGHLGRLDEARQVWADLTSLHPAYRLETHLGRLPWPDASGPERIKAGLAKAGLPG
jgi:adenylate cyclase